jgi:hypothetical protein
VHFRYAVKMAAFTAFSAVFGFNGRRVLCVTVSRGLRHASGDGVDRPRGFFDDLADLRLADDQRRRQNKRVAGAP